MHVNLLCKGVVTVDSAGTNKGFWGFGASLYASNNVSIGFVTDGGSGNWYTHTATGVAHTDTAISNLTDGPHTLRIEVDLGNGTPQARFYVDGTLVQTMTTTPSSSKCELR
jgi:hypothetical protein